MRTKRVKAWAIVNKKDPSDIYAAYPDRLEARTQKREHAGFHKKDVIRPCTITITNPRSRK